MVNNDNLNHIKSLDGLRGIAALMVVFFHSPIPLFQFEFGWIGVNLFFILSGFLITSILLEIKQQPFNIYIKNFYSRRALRIFPLYFMYLILVFLVLLLLNKGYPVQDENTKQGFLDFKNNYPYLLTFTYNLGSVVNFLVGKDYHNSVFTGHLWTLSVEVQFYIIFALIVYFLRIKILKILCVAFIFIVPLLRLSMVLYFEGNHFPPFWIGSVLYNFTLFQLDSLAMGSCLALFNFSRIIKNSTFYLSLLIILIIIVGTVHLIYLRNDQVENSSLGYDLPVYHIAKKPSLYPILNNRYFYTIPIINLTFGLLMLLMIKNRIHDGFFANKFLTTTGRISYSIYIYHLALSYFFILLVKTIFSKEPGQFDWPYQIGFMVIYLAILFLIAGLSYRHLEKWFLRPRKSN